MMKEKHSKMRKTNISKTKKPSESADPYNSIDLFSKESTPAVISAKSESKKKIISDKITADMNIGEILEKHPEAREKLMLLGLGCAGCHFAAFDTLENGANIHGMDVDDLLDELND